MSKTVFVVRNGEIKRRTYASASSHMLTVKDGSGSLTRVYKERAFNCPEHESALYHTVKCFYDVDRAIEYAQEQLLKQHECIEEHKEMLEKRSEELHFLKAEQYSA